MTKIILATLCDDVRQEIGGKKSLMGIFSQFVVNDFRAPLPPFCLYAVLGFDESGVHSVSVEFRRVEGTQIFKADGNHTLEQQDPATQQYHAIINLRFNNMRLPGTGRYEFALQCDGHHVGAIPINVVQPAPRLVQ